MINFRTRLEWVGISQTKNCSNNLFSDKSIRESTYKCLAVINNKIGAKILNVYIADLKEDKKKLIEEAIAELKAMLLVEFQSNQITKGLYIFIRAPVHFKKLKLA